MRKFALISFLLVFLGTVSLSDVRNKDDFISAAITITASTTVVHGTDYTSKPIPLANVDHPVVGIVVTFTRAVGAASTLDCNFQVSYDGGTTWSSYDDGQIQVATNHAAISGNIVRYYTLMALYGVTHVRLSSMTNNWSGGSLTAVNVTLMTSRAR